MQYEVIVEPKKEVLDPEGRAIKETLARLGKSSISEIRVGKRFLITLEDGSAVVEENIAEIAKDFLANPVAEQFSLRKID